MDLALSIFGLEKSSAAVQTNTVNGRQQFIIPSPASSSTQGPIRQLTDCTAYIVLWDLFYTYLETELFVGVDLAWCLEFPPEARM